ncbi:MAG: phage tail assembly chaperone [Sphingopyxis sp.]
MADLFAHHAARLAGVAGALLGWRPDEFWRATPEELIVVLAALNPADGAADAMPDAAALHRLKEQFPDE